MKLHTKIAIGFGTGVVVGIATNALAGGQPWVEWFNANLADPAGKIFLRLLLMVVIPLVFASLTLGVAGLGDIRKVGKVGGKTLLYFLATTAAAAVLGLVLANVIRPGAGVPADVRDRLMETYATDAARPMAAAESEGFGVHTFVQIVPRNPMQAAADFDVLGVIFFALLFGAALTVIPKAQSEPMVRILSALNDVVVKIIDIVMRLAPYGVFALIFVVTSKFGWGIVRQLGVYVLLAVFGMLVHSAVTLAAALRFGAGVGPVRFLRAVQAVIVTAFSTSSSSATLPTSLRVAETKLGLPREVASFVLPIGATMNMNGTAVFEAITVLFIAQVFGIELSLGMQVILLVLVVLTAIAAAGVPSGAIPLIVVMLYTVGVPGEGIALMLGVDRILDMCRTVINVGGDLTAATFVAKSEGAWVPAEAAEPLVPATT